MTANDKDSRPPEYRLGKHLYSDLYAECEELGWERCLREIISRYYVAVEADPYMTMDEPKKLEEDTYDLILVGTCAAGEDFVSLVPSHNARYLYYELIGPYQLPNFEKPEIDNHNQLINYILDYVSNHWIVEMYYLMVKLHDSARMYPGNWDYQK